jgi:hypothetical protein
MATMLAVAITLTVVIAALTIVSVTLTIVEMLGLMPKTLKATIFALFPAGAGKKATVLAVPARRDGNTVNAAGYCESEPEFHHFGFMGCSPHSFLCVQELRYDFRNGSLLKYK